MPILMHIPQKTCPECGFKQWYVSDNYVKSPIRPHGISDEEWQKKMKENDRLLTKAKCHTCKNGNPLRRMNMDVDNQNWMNDLE